MIVRSCRDRACGAVESPAGFFLVTDIATCILVPIHMTAQTLAMISSGQPRLFKVILFYRLRMTGTAKKFVYIGPLRIVMVAGFTAFSHPNHALMFSVIESNRNVKVLQFAQDDDGGGCGDGNGDNFVPRTCLEGSGAFLGFGGDVAIPAIRGSTRGRWLGR